MVRLFPWRRLVGALIAPWFALVMAGPAALHACSVHGEMGHGTAAAMSHGMRAHAGMASHAPQPDQPPGGQCNCIGGCCPASPVRAEAPATLAISTLQRVADAPLPEHAGAPASVREHLLPFANGPPSRA